MDLRQEVKTWKEIEVGGVKYKIVNKFLACVTGIDSASSTYSCIWCKCSAEEHWYMGKHWSISSTSQGARTIEENVRLSKLPKSETQRIQNLWSELLDINLHFSKKPEELSNQDIVQYKSQCQQWVIKFVAIYHLNAATHYIHAMAQHAGDFIQLHGLLLAFTQQG